MIIFIDGITAVGKTTLCNALYGNHFQEKKYESNLPNFLDRQYVYILDRLNLLSKLSNSINLIDTSFLNLISFTLFSSNLTKEESIVLIDKLIFNSPPKIKIIKIIYLFAPLTVIYKRKKEDISRKRNSFSKNILHYEKEQHFYTLLSLIYPNSIVLLDSCESIESKINFVNNFYGKEISAIEIMETIKILIYQNLL